MLKSQELNTNNTDLVGFCYWSTTFCFMVPYNRTRPRRAMYIVDDVCEILSCTPQVC